MQTIRTNLKINASTQYSNFDFTSMCMFNGVMLGAGPSGLFRVGCGSDDNGTDISSYFTTFVTKLGHDGDKRLMFVYLGIETAGTVIVTPYYDGVAGDAVTFTPTGTGRQYMRRPVGRGFRGCYVTFKVENVDGCWFAIDEVQVLPGYLPLRQG